MLTCIGFNKTAGTVSASYETIAGVADQSMPFGQSGTFLPQVPYKLKAAFLRYLHATAARINSPWLRRNFLPEIFPGEVSATVPDNPAYCYYDDYGPMLQAGEGFTLEVSGDATAATRVQGALFLEDVFQPASRGQAFTMPYDVTVTTAAGVWTAALGTARQNLTAGTYEVVGMAAVGTESTAVRLVYTGIGGARPGCIPMAAYGNTMAPQLFRFGRAGSFGRFTQISQPQFEFLGFAGAAETPIVYLDLVKISDSINMPSNLNY